MRRVKWLRNRRYFYEKVLVALKEMDLDPMENLKLTVSLMEKAEESFSKEYNCVMDVLHLNDYNTVCSEEDFIVITLQCPHAIQKRVFE